MNRLQKKYQEILVPKLQQEWKLGNRLMVPRLEKVVVSTSFKEEQRQDEAIKIAAGWMAAMTGQRPAPTVARQSIASFGIRDGDVIGLKVTLRGKRMWDFVDRLISLALPRVRDFQGISLSGFDGQGNYTLGMAEQIIFPEVEYDTVGKVRGLQIVFVTSATDDVRARRLLEAIGMPFEKQETMNHSNLSSWPKGRKQ